ncbi:hypothetical protein GLAREA_04935 [Glarea lozoyensis ATCC 20868]|uniref:Uncharacterized protein n=1 Tax=Glarea lozoyensis (strain ATCC 20868 / MF5171) TaxID=1116229 RepID=S3CST4_GLAL2|nr:uncharacterized protein GLAREA_04935 [Glarea lozoyensis ATCC 20868]EPE28144.1 hypothetical protein GLAREA_04935 [Glarea lozoyensis ATCC 20868]
MPWKRMEEALLMEQYPHSKVAGRVKNVGMTWNSMALVMNKNIVNRRLPLRERFNGSMVRMQFNKHRDEMLQFWGEDGELAAVFAGRDDFEAANILMMMSMSDKPSAQTQNKMQNMPERFVDGIPDDDDETIEDPNLICDSTDEEEADAILQYRGRRSKETESDASYTETTDEDSEMTDTPASSSSSDESNSVQYGPFGEPINHGMTYGPDGKPLGPPDYTQYARYIHSLENGGTEYDERDIKNARSCLKQTGHKFLATKSHIDRDSPVGSPLGRHGKSISDRWEELGALLNGGY